MFYSFPSLVLNLSSSYPFLVLILSLSLLFMSHYPTSVQKVVSLRYFTKFITGKHIRHLVHVFTQRVHEQIVSYPEQQPTIILCSDLFIIIYSFGKTFKLKQ